MSMYTLYSVTVCECKSATQLAAQSSSGELNYVSTASLRVWWNWLLDIRQLDTRGNVHDVHDVHL